MRLFAKSLGHALTGLRHALETERNLKYFLVGYLLILLAGLAAGLDPADWIAVIIASGVFFAIELLNTALERLVDTFDDYRKQMVGNNYHVGLKRTKDVASSAALMGLLTLLAVLAVVFPPHLNILLGL